MGLLYRIRTEASPVTFAPMRYLFLLLVICISTIGISQDPIPPAELEGLQLRQWLRTNWYQPWHDELGYSEARVAMYSTIDVEGGTIECVYSGFSQPATFNSYPNPINTEHTVPQSFFDGDLPMRSDIHHLFPTHGQANSDRGNLPFGEVVDSQTDGWLNGSAGSYSSSGSIPNSGIDDYSEVHFNNAFEPREENKGNTARAVFYFYTMYANDMESGFEDISSAGDLNTLYNWHVMDPPDALEIERDEQIQAIQGNYNPYVRMPGLAATAWGFVSSVDEYTIDIDLIQDGETIRVLNVTSGMSLSLLNALGQEVMASKGLNQFSTIGLDAGIYFLRLTDQKGRGGVKRFFIQ